MVPESHFASVLHTNYVPSTKELEELKYLIVEPQERILKLNEEIVRLQAERDELQQFVDSHRVLAAPFRRFPPDIWGEIFTHCLPTNNLNVSVCTVKEAPLLLTGVCRTWREIALNIPRLWSSVHVVVPNPPMPTVDDSFLTEVRARSLQGIRLWMDRSGSRPFTLSIQMTGDFPSTSPSDEDKVRYSELMDLLVRYSRRWKTLSLGSGVTPLHQEPLTHLTKDDVPLLEVVRIRHGQLFTVSPQGTEPRSSPISNLLCELTSLHSLQMNSSLMSVLSIPLGLD